MRLKEDELLTQKWSEIREATVWNSSTLPYSTLQPFHFLRGLFSDTYEIPGKFVSERGDILYLGALSHLCEQWHL